MSGCRHTVLSLWPPPGPPDVPAPLGPHQSAGSPGPTHPDWWVCGAPETAGRLGASLRTDVMWVRQRPVRRSRLYAAVGKRRVRHQGADGVWVPSPVWSDGEQRPVLGPAGAPQSRAPRDGGDAVSIQTDGPQAVCGRTMGNRGCVLGPGGRAAASAGGVCDQPLEGSFTQRISEITRGGRQAGRLWPLEWWTSPDHVLVSCSVETSPYSPRGTLRGTRGGRAVWLGTLSPQGHEGQCLSAAAGPLSSLTAPPGVAGKAPLPPACTPLFRRRSFRSFYIFT